MCRKTNILRAIVALLTLAAAGESAALDRRHFTVTTREIQGFGDWDGDGDLDVVIIDRPHSEYRIGIRQADHSIVWQKPRATGIEYPEHLSVHRVNDPLRDQMLISSTQSNRVHLITPGHGSAAQPLFIAPQGVEPTSAVAIDVPRPGNDPALADIIVQSNRNHSTPITALEYFQSTGGGIARDGPLLPTSTLHLLEAARVKLLESGPEYYAGFYKPSTGRLVVTSLNASGLPTTVTSTTGLFNFTQMVHAPLRADLPDRNVFVFYQRNTSTIRISVPDATGILATPVSRSLPNFESVDNIYVTRTTAGGYAMFIIHSDGTAGQFFTLDSSNNLVPGEVMSLGDEGVLSGALAFGTDHLLLLSSRGFDDTTTHAQRLFHDGTGWQDMGTTRLPVTAAFPSRTNVFVYAGEPLVVDKPTLLRSMQVPDWTSGPSVTGGNVGVMRELFGTETSGLGSPGFVFFGNVPGATHAMANQLRPDVAVISADQTLGDAVPQVKIVPPPAHDYRTYIQPKLGITSQHPPGDIRAWYRTTNLAAWTEFDLTSDTAHIALTNGALSLTRIWFYAESISTGRRSPSYQVDYDFTGEARGHIDSDSDGLPDFVELAKGLDPRGGPDSDGDGFSDLNEVIAGTDPLHALSKPTEAQRLGGDSHFNLRVKPLAHDGEENGGPTLPAWPEFTSPGVTQDDHPYTVLSVHEVDGSLMRNARTTNHSTHLTFNPAADFPLLPAGERDSFRIISTPVTWQADVGAQNLEALTPELIGLVPAPHIEPLVVDWSYVSNIGHINNANAWIQAYSDALDAREVPEIQQQLDYRDAIELLLVERLLARRAALRGLIPKEKISLTAFRDPLPPAPSGTAGWQGNFLLSEEQLLSLTQMHASGIPPVLPHHLLAQVRDYLRNSGTTIATDFNKLASEFHRLYVDDNGSNPGAFGNPFDHLRTIVQDLPAVAQDVDGLITLPGDPDQLSYVGKIDLNSAQIASAEKILMELLDLQLDRPMQTYVGTWNPYNSPSFYIDDLDDNAELLRADGSVHPMAGIVPDLLTNARLRVHAYTDRFEWPALEVASIEVLSVNIPSPSDWNEDLMDDSLHDYWFADGGQFGPYDDDDGDGYVNYQELLDRTDPRSASDRPLTAALPPRPPSPRISQTALSTLRLDLDYPEQYSDQIGFELLRSYTLAGFDSTSEEALPTSASTHSLQIEKPSGEPREFYRFRMFLRGGFQAGE